MTLVTFRRVDTDKDLRVPVDRILFIQSMPSPDEATLVLGHMSGLSHEDRRVVVRREGPFFEALNAAESMPFTPDNKPEEDQP